MTKEIFEFAFRLKETENQTKFSIFGVAVLVFVKKSAKYREKLLIEVNLPAIKKLELGTFENSAIRSCCISFCPKKGQIV